MSRDNVHPEILDGLEYESQFIQNTSGAQRRDVKLGRGDAWLMRYLPAQLGPNKRFYARIAKHWMNMKAVVCPRFTEEAFGGDPNAYCAVCDLADQLNNDRNEDVSKFGFKLRGNPNWITYAVVFEKATGGGQPQAMSMPEVLQPYQHQHYKTSWEELTSFIRQGTRRSPLSVLDFEKGNDFWVSKTAKGLRLDKQDSAPIFKLDDPQYDEWTQKLLAACKDPVVKMPTEKQMDDFAAKAEEEADNIARGGSGRGGGGGGRGGAAPRGGNRGGHDEDDLPPEDDAPPARGRRAPVEDQEPAPAPRRAAPTQEAAPAPRRTAAAPAPAAAAPARRAAPAPAPEPEPQDELPPEDSGDLPPEEQEQPAPAPAPAPARTTARPSAQRPSAAAAAAPTPAPARRAAAAPAPAPARAAAPRGGAVAEESLDPDENVPEEANDAAPPQPLIDPSDEGGNDAPPPVERRGAFSSNMRSKLAAANNTAKQ